jgi:hypothetical protein
MPFFHSVGRPKHPPGSDLKSSAYGGLIGQSWLVQFFYLAGGLSVKIDHVYMPLYPKDVLD